jgi:hypothetical protein
MLYVTFTDEVNFKHATVFPTECAAYLTASNIANILIMIPHFVAAHLTSFISVTLNKDTAATAEYIAPAVTSRTFLA